MISLTSRIASKACAELKAKLKWVLSGTPLRNRVNGIQGGLLVSQILFKLTCHRISPVFSIHRNRCERKAG